MLRIVADDSDLVVQLDIPPRLNKGLNQHYLCKVSLGGSTCTVAAMAELLSANLSERISQIREEAYLQGVRDRAKKATTFSGSLQSGGWKGGCTGG